LSKLNLPKLENKAYWKVIRWWANNVEPKSDGCTGVKDWFIESCWEHDFHYRYAMTIYKEPVTFDQANDRLKESIQMRSKLRWFSPISWTRWLGVKAFGHHAWNKHRKENKPFPYLPINPEGE
jgi:hypothetical protein